MFAISKTFTNFATLYLHICGEKSVDFFTYLYKRLGVVYPYSYCSAVCECSNFGRHHAFFLSKNHSFFKFFTNATLSKKSQPSEGEYLGRGGCFTKRNFILSIHRAITLQVGTPFLLAWGLCHSAQIQQKILSLRPGQKFFRAFAKSSRAFKKILYHRIIFSFLYQNGGANCLCGSHPL